VEPIQYPYRVFVSYAEEDRRHASRIVSRLCELDLQPVWDQDNAGGWPFVELTKRRIAHAHLFLPLLTPHSVQSTWVNQEIGFAVGRCIPVLPLSLGPLPSGMAGELHAEVADQIDDLLPRLTRESVDRLMRRGSTTEVYEFADDPESRSTAIIGHCQDLAGRALPRPQRLRYRAAFGSFSLPADPDDPIWERRYDGEPWRAGHSARKKALSEERRWLEQHALSFGGDLILYPSLPHLTPVAIGARVEILRSSLASLQKASANVRVIFDPSALGENLLIVGDWFCAESIAPRADGYRHTTLTSHAPTVLDRILRFERKFDQGSWMSADRAIAWLDQHRARLFHGL